MSALLIVSIFWFVSEVVLSRMLRVKDVREHEDRSSLKIIWLTIIASIFLGIYISKTDFTINLTYGTQMYNLGIILICIGLIIRWIAIISLKKFFKVHVNVSQDQKIIKSGIYKFVRHPSYTGSLLSFLGLGVVFNNWLTLIIVFIPVLLAFLYRIKVEEKVLLGAFATSYSEYMMNTKKLIPFIY
jgi:protein-S-isoprenylcysteine O-methyltransferase Ste14